MKRQVGATTILAALLLLVGATLLTGQWPTANTPGGALASPFFLVAEVAVYLVLLIILDRGLTAAGYAWGAFGALGVRLAVGFGAAGLGYLRAGGPYDAHLFPAVFSPARVAIGVATSAVMLVLLRDVLPQRPRRVGAAPAKAAKASAGKGEQSPRLAFEVEQAERAVHSPSKVMLVDGPVPSRPVEPEPAERTFDGYLELPLGVLLRHAPRQIRAAEGQEETLVRLPMSMVGPQLGEAEVAVTADWLAEVAPPGALDISGVEAQTEVTLPLEAVVAALPAGALDPGPPSPPGWQVELEESEEALFSAA